MFVSYGFLGKILSDQIPWQIGILQTCRKICPVVRKGLEPRSGRDYRVASFKNEENIVIYA